MIRRGRRGRTWPAVEKNYWNRVGFLGKQGYEVDGEAFFAECNVRCEVREGVHMFFALFPILDRASVEPLPRQALRHNLWGASETKPNVTARVQVFT